MELNELQKGYIAGIIDGEGSICLTQNSPNEHRSPAVTVASTTYEILEYLKNVVGGTISKKTKTEERYKQSWHWAIRGNKSIELLEQITPYLLVPEKKYRANLIITEYKAVTPRNGKYSKEMLEKKLDFEKRFFANK